MIALIPPWHSQMQAQVVPTQNEERRGGGGPMLLPANSCRGSRGTACRLRRSEAASINDDDVACQRGRPLLLASPAAVSNKGASVTPLPATGHAGPGRAVRIRDGRGRLLLLVLVILVILVMLVMLLRRAEAEAAPKPDPILGMLDECTFRFRSTMLNQPRRSMRPCGAAIEARTRPILSSPIVSMRAGRFYGRERTPCGDKKSAGAGGCVREVALVCVDACMHRPLPRKD